MEWTPALEVVCHGLHSAPGRYNCKEEFQIHDELLKAHYTLGRLSDATPEHYLVQVRSGPALPIAFWPLSTPPVLLPYRLPS